MKLEKIFIAAALLSLIIALPITVALKKAAEKLDAEHKNSVHLQFKVESMQKEVEQEESTNKSLKSNNDSLNKQLESKRVAQSTVASIQQGDKPAVSVSTTATGCAQWRSIVEQYNWDVNTAMAIMKAESGPNCDASATNTNQNGSIDRGLFQINSVHADMVPTLSALFDPATNIHIAFALYSGHHSWSPWSTYLSGAYLEYEN